MVQMREELAANQALLQDQEKTWEERLQEAEKVRETKRQREVLGERLQEAGGDAVKAVCVS